MPQALRMRAIVQDAYGSPGVLRLAEVDRPVIGDDGVLVRVRASSVNPADLAVVTGRPGLVRLASGLRRPRRPVPGRDLAGVVEAVGPAVTGVRPGDEVHGEAGQAFAEYAAVRPEQLWPKPANLTFEQAATLPLAGLTAWQALDRASIRPGQRVLVHGASGGVGHFAVQIAKAQGAEVTAVCSGRSAEMVAGLGADHVIDYGIADYTTLGQRYDAIVDVVVTHRLSDVRRALAPHGVYLSVGTAPGTGPGEGGLLGPLPSIAGVVARSLAARPQRLVAVAATANRGLAELTALVESGAVTPHIERTYPLAEVPDALRHLASHHVRGKLAITV
jgi:NADPH:quinone reductase-like Zn-dependent oxidoreductase